MANQRVPLWQRLLARPRLLHRLASATILGAAGITAVASFVRSAPGEVRQDALALTYLFDLMAWSLVVVASFAEAFVAGVSAPRLRAGGRPHYLIVFIVGFLLASLLLSATLYFAVETDRLTLAGRIVKAGAAGMLPLLVAVTLTAGSTLVWVTQLQPRLVARLEAQVREFEATYGPGAGQSHEVAIDDRTSARAGKSTTR